MDDHHLAWLALSELNLTFKQGSDLAQLYGYGPTVLEQQGSPQLGSILNSTQSHSLARLTSVSLQLSLATQLQWVEDNDAFLLLHDDVSYPDALKSHSPSSCIFMVAGAQKSTQ